MPKYLVLKCIDGKTWKVSKKLHNKCLCYLEMESYLNEIGFWHEEFKWYFMVDGKQIQMMITTIDSGKSPSYSTTEHRQMITSYQ